MTIEAFDYPPHDEDWYPTTAEPLALRLEVLSLEAIDLVNAARDLARSVHLSFPGTRDLRLLADTLHDEIDAYHPRTFRADLEPANAYHVLEQYTTAARLLERARALVAAYRFTD